MIGIGISPMMGAPTVASAFNCVYKELFGSGEQGIYMPSVHESFLRGDLYQTSSGDTPVTAVGQPVGLWLDRSNGLAVGENDVADPNCENLTGSGWFRGSGYALGITQEAGGIRVERPPSGVDIYIRPLKSSDGTQFEVGTYVEIEIEIADVVAGGIRIELVAGNNASNLTINTPGTHILRRRLGNNLTFVPGLDTGDAATIRRVSVREIPGNHASQSTAASRPVLQQDANGIYVLRFDGVDDWMALDGLATVFEGLGPRIAIAGFNQISAATSYPVILRSVNVASPVTKYNLIVFSADGSAGVEQSEGGSTNTATVAAGSVNVGESHVIAAVGTTTTLQTRLDGGSKVSPVVTPKDLGTSHEYNPSIGSRTAASLAPHMDIYGLIVCGAEKTLAQIEAAERLINKYTRAY